jgi:hypothetical protein
MIYRLPPNQPFRRWHFVAAGVCFLLLAVGMVLLDRYHADRDLVVLLGIACGFFLIAGTLVISFPLVAWAEEKERRKRLFKAQAREQERLRKAFERKKPRKR